MSLVYPVIADPHGVHLAEYFVQKFIKDHTPTTSPEAEEDISVKTKLSKGQKKKLAAKRRKLRLKEQEVEMAKMKQEIPGICEDHGVNIDMTQTSEDELIRRMNDLIIKGIVDPETMIPMEVELRNLINNHKNSTPRMKRDALKSSVFKEMFEIDEIKDFDKDLQRLLKIIGDKKHWFQCGLIPKEDQEEWLLTSFRWVGSIQTEMGMSPIIPVWANELIFPSCITHAKF